MNDYAGMIAVLGNAMDNLNKVVAWCEDEGHDFNELWGQCNGMRAAPAAPYLFMQSMHDPDVMLKGEKVDAVRWAEILGQDWAQKLYRFAVLVTKLT